MRSEARRKPPSARPRESGDLEMLDSRFRGNERRKETPRWSAERRASRVMGRKAPRKRLACRVISAFTRVFDARWHAQRVLRTHPNVSRRSAHPSIRVGEAKLQTPGAEMRRGNEVGCLKS